MECNHCGMTRATSERRIFCPGCGKCDPAQLKSVKLQGFTGAASLSPAVEKFWRTGDPNDA